MFLTFLTEKLSEIESVRNAYKDDQEMMSHFLSGEVSVPITEILKYVDQYLVENADNARLVSFGNYLFKKHNVMQLDENGSPMYERQVSHADVCNWEELNSSILEEYQEIKLPKHLPVGTNAYIGFHGKEKMNVKILGVHFYGDYHSKKNIVKYDLELKFAFEPPTRMYNIDSSFISETP